MKKICMQRFIKIDGKVRTDVTYPAGFMDVISIDKIGENFRLIYDTKGRFAVHRITPEDAKVSGVNRLGCCFKVLNSELQPELSTWADSLW